jgi:DNA-directed RNA polymerase subunit RPC12/RpoP
MSHIYPTTGRPRAKGRTKLRDKSLLNPNAKKTIDLLHNTQQEYFKTKYESLSTLESGLKEKVSRLEKLKLEIEKHIEDNKIPDMVLENNKWELEDEIEKLKQEIFNIKNAKEEKEYLLKSGQILHQYKKFKEQEKQNIRNISLTGNSDSIDFSHFKIEIDYNNPNNDINNNQNNNSNNDTNNNVNNNSNTSTTKKSKPKIDIFSFMTRESDNSFTVNDLTNKVSMSPNFKIKKKNKHSQSQSQCDTNKNTNSNQVKPEQKEQKEEKKNDLSSYLIIDKAKEESNKNKKKIYEKYMKLLDPNYIDMTPNTDNGFDICFHCKKEMVLNHNSGMIQCQNCGISEKILVNTDKQSHKEPPKEITAFSYRRINHINEIISQLQGKQTTEIPKEIFEKIQNEIKKMKISIKNVNKSLIKQILKKINANKYYEHSVYIMNQLGVPKTTFSREVEEILRELFKQVEPVFEKYCPPNRKNFLKYEYFFYKLFELLEMDEYLHICDLPKDPRKTYETEKIWKNICKDLKWEFIKSV